MTCTTWVHWVSCAPSDSSGIHRRITNIRVNAAHQFTADITKHTKPKAIVIEDLKPKNMSKNHKLASAILDANFGRMRQFLEYKCAWLGILLFFAPQFYASSRYCSHCGQYYNKDLTLDDREWVCPVCGHRHDRDYNAARNLQRKLLRPAPKLAMPPAAPGETPESVTLGAMVRTDDKWEVNCKQNFS